MKQDKNIQRTPYGDETPRLKDWLIVMIVVAVLIALSWIAYYKFHI